MVPKKKNKKKSSDFNVSELILSYKVPEMFLDEDSTFNNRMLYCFFSLTAKDSYHKKQK